MHLPEFLSVLDLEFLMPIPLYILKPNLLFGVTSVEGHVSAEMPCRVSVQ